jgi:hypothetical protein
MINWTERAKAYFANNPAPEPEQPAVPDSISTTQLSKIAGINLPTQLLKELGIKPFAQTKTGFFWAKEDVPIIFLKISKHFTDKAKEELNKK